MTFCQTAGISDRGEELRKCRAIDNATLHSAGQQIPAKRVNRYVTDGEVAVAELNDMEERSLSRI